MGIPCHGNAGLMEDTAPPPYKSPRSSNVRKHRQTLLDFGSLYPGHVALKAIDSEDFKMRLHSATKTKTCLSNSSRGYESNRDDDRRREDKSSLEYPNSRDSILPYSVNDTRSLYPFKTPQPLEGFMTRKMHNAHQAAFRSRESNLRPRHGNLAATKREELAVVEGRVPRDNDKCDRFSKRKNDFQLCLKKTDWGLSMKQYCVNSSLHGLRYVGDSGLSTFERLFWIVSFVAAVLTAAYFIWSLYQKWVTTPIIISLSPESVALTDIPFPSVTICNMNNAKKTEATRINQGDDDLEKLLLEDICDFQNDSIIAGLDYQSASWSNVQRFMINVSQSCSDMLHLCQWHQNATECEKIFNPIMTDEGICCNFNAVHKKFMFYNPHEWSDLNITFPFSGIDWTPERGYPAHTPVDTVPWRPIGAGRHLGLTLVLDAEIKEYYCSSTASVGFKMHLHNPVETPKIADFAFAISPGRETRVIITPRISTASLEILKVPQRKRKCFFVAERKLKYYRTYTQRNCILECEANYTQAICKCVQHYMPKSAHTPICGKKDDLCARSARTTMELKLFEEDNSTNNLNVTKSPSCNCWPGCFEINYDIEISQSQLMTSFDVDDAYVKENDQYFVKNMAVVHLYFVQSQFTKYAKNELFGFTEFLSSTGGLLGLFMGFSFLSVVEIVYFLTLRFWCRLCRNKSTPSRALLRVQPVVQNQKVVYPFAQ